MKLFRCLIEGVNFPFEFEDEPGPVGFFTTRFVRAESAEEAEMMALEMLRSDPTMDIPPEKRTKDAMVYFEEIEEITEIPDGCSEPGTGYTFFPMNSR